MALLTEAYRLEQRRLHESPAYGSRAFNWGYLVAGIARIERCASILDYGSGKGTLGKSLRKAGFDTRNYDPAIDGDMALPEKADLVVSVDVLEHIEPVCLDAVLDHIGSLTGKVLFVAISTRPAKRWLVDGRNAHLIVEDGETWWRPRLEARGLGVRRVWATGIPEWVALLRRDGGR